jgi:hypothetical protein
VTGSAAATNERGVWLSIISVGRRCDVHVTEVYRAVLEGELPARLPTGDEDRVTILDSDADAWAAARPPVRAHTGPSRAILGHPRARQDLTPSHA